MSVLGFLAFSNSTKYPIRSFMKFPSQTISVSSKWNDEISDRYETRDVGALSLPHVRGGKLNND
jgi:hypothetical protein